MKRIYILLIAFNLPFLIWGQEKTGAAFTLEQCIQFALENSVRAKNAVLDQRIAKAMVSFTFAMTLDWSGETAAGLQL